MTKRRKRPTLNIEHRTSNAEPKKGTRNGRRITRSIENKPQGLRVVEESRSDYRNRRHYDLEDRLLEFAAMIVQLVESLVNTKAGNHIAAQLLRCGTSPLSNHGEVEAAESRKDFLHKLRVCLKELRETKRWLRLVGRLELTEPLNLNRCLNEADELIRIFVASIRTAEENAP
jgi:four helix bundle protein